MIFVTTGSMLPFDRLIRLIDDFVEEGVITDEVYAQIGEGTYTPKHYKFTRFIEKSEFDRLITGSSLVISHAGIGVIMECLEAKTPLLVLPRQSNLGEHVNDHQITTAEKFQSLGHIIAFEESNFAQKLAELKTFSPKPRAPNAEGVGNRIAQYLQQLIETA